MPALEMGRWLGRRPTRLVTAGALRAAATTLTVLVLAACSSGSAGTSPATSQVNGISSAIEVHVADFKITPTQLQALGPTVTLNVTNDGPTIHNVSVRDGSGTVLLHTRDLKPGESETISGQLPKGDLITFCSLPGHESLGTKGTLVVTRP